MNFTSKNTDVDCFLRFLIEETYLENVSFPMSINWDLSSMFINWGTGKFKTVANEKLSKILFGFYMQIFLV